MKMRDLQLNPPGAEGVKLSEHVYYCIMCMIHCILLFSLVFPIIVWSRFVSWCWFWWWWIGDHSLVCI